MNGTELEVQQAEAGLETVVPKTELQKLEFAVETLTVTCQAELDQANELLRLIARFARGVEDYWTGLENPAHALWKKLKDRARPWRELFSSDKEFKAHPRNLRGKVEPKIITYLAEERRQREAEEARLRALAEQERKRIQDEAQAAMLRGQVAEAKDLRQVAAATVAPILAEPTKTKGVSTPVTWHAEVADLKLLVTAWLNGEVPEDVIVANMAFLNKMAIRWQEQFSYPGVKAVSETGVKVRG